MQNSGAAVKVVGLTSDSKWELKHFFSVNSLKFSKCGRAVPEM